MAERKIVVLVHGWSVQSTETYGQLPDRLEAEAKAQAGLDIDIQHIWLGRYVSFRDEVRLEDISRAFESALRHQLGAELDRGRKIAVITHSTGGPVVRDWWQRIYVDAGKSDACPLSHLIMLAPANFGSALAQLGKGALGRLSSWFKGAEPGQGVLDWLELGSAEAFALNLQWIQCKEAPSHAANPMFPFVLTGQSIDRKLYDHVNSYTGESGSDGVVRVAAANLNATYVRLVQEAPQQRDDDGTGPHLKAPNLIADPVCRARRTAFAVLPGLSHSGEEMGILRSIPANGPHAAVPAIVRCLLVTNAVDYDKVCDDFETMTKRTQEEERLETHGKILLPDTYTIHDPRTMLIVRVLDDHGHVIDDFDFLLLGKDSSPDRLPPGFFVDRQCNKRNRGTITYFLNHEVLTDSQPVVKGDTVLRPAIPGANELGFRVEPRPQEGFVHYLCAELQARRDTLEGFVRANETLLLDIVLRRIVHTGTFTLTQNRAAEDFTDVPTGGLLSITTPSGT